MIQQLLNVSAAEVPSGYRMQVINGFVEELVVNDDPEYQWIDKIRTPRASNEARQRLFSKLSGVCSRISTVCLYTPVCFGISIIYLTPVFLNLLLGLLNKYCSCSTTIFNILGS